MTASTEETYRGLTARLKAVRHRSNAAAICMGSIAAGLLFAAILMAASLAEAALFLPGILRAVLFWLGILAVGAIWLWRAGVPALRRLGLSHDESDETTAARVGKAFPSVNDRLLNLMQLLREQRPMYSQDLIDASANDLEHELSPLDFTSSISFAPVRRFASYLAAAAVVVMLFFFLFPATFAGAAYRLAHYRTEFERPLPFQLVLEPGDREVVRGETITGTVHVIGEQQQTVTLNSRPDGEVNFEQKSLHPDASGNFRFEFPSLKTSTVYYAHAAGVQTQEYKLSVSDRPIVRMLKVEVASPAYSRLPVRSLEDNAGDIQALRGSRASFTIQSNKTLSGLRLVFSDSSTIRLDVHGSRAAGSVQLSRNLTYHIELHDSSGTPNKDPIEYSIRILPDDFPVVAIVIPGNNMDVADNTTLPMVFSIRDDYGFSRLRLAYKLTHSRFEQPANDFTFRTIPIPAGFGLEGTIAFSWGLEELHLAPEDVVTYYAEVWDNDNVSGPKSAVSETYFIRMPSLNEVFAEVNKGHEESIDNLQEAAKQSEQARRDIEELRQDVKKNSQKMDWQEKKKAEDLAKRYEEVQKKIEETNKTVERMVDQMQKNRLLSQETLEKYMELQQLMEQLNSPELADAMKQLQQAIQQMNPDAMNQALQKFQFSEENFRKGIERTLNLLKRIQIEQKVDEAAKRAEQILAQQKDLQRRTDSVSASPQDGEKLAREQRDLRSQAEDMRRQLAELQKKMEEFAGEMPLTQMEDINRKMDESGLNEKLEQIAQQMQQQNLREAAQGQRKAAETLSSVSRQLREMKEAMQSNQARQAMKEMRRATQDVLDLSQRQETLKNEARSLDPNAPGYREQARKQMDLLRDLGNLIERMTGLSQKSFAVTPELGKSIGEALQKMNGAAQSLEQRNGGAAEQQQSGAMGALNITAQMMQSALNAMMQGGGQGTGMAGLLQRLQQMAGMQQGINQGTQQLGGMSQEQAAAMARLAGEQGVVRKSLEQLAKEAASGGQLNKLLGDLGRIAQEMREVQTDLAQGSVNPETLHKQDRILSRLLDASRSARERDFEKKRKAESGTNVARTSPAALDPSTQEGKNKLRQDLLKALEEGYAPDYQELIRKYFEALER